MTLDERDGPDTDPGGAYVLAEPGFTIIRGLLGTGSTVLDIGCGHGNVGAFLGEAGMVVDGIEPDEERAAVAAQVLHHVCTAPLADAVGSPELRATYDAVTMIDVVEHVVRPTEALEQAATFMDGASRLLLFVPNSAHWSFRSKVLRGDWSYADRGLFDRTHLRFFDLATASALGPSAGLVETRRWATTPGPSLTSRHGPRLRPNLFALHFLFELRKP